MAQQGIPDSEVLDGVVRRHRAWVAVNRPRWREFRAAFSDAFWSDPEQRSQLEQRTKTAGGSQQDGRLLMQSNLIRPWIVSYEASLFYKAPKTSVRPDDVLRGDEVTSDPKPIEDILDRWLNTAPVIAAASRAFRVALMYPECALKMGLDRHRTHPVDQVFVDLMPPWECVWDRHARRPDQHRYKGHIYWDSVESVARRFGLDRATLSGQVRPDQLFDGETATMGYTSTSPWAGSASPASVAGGEAAYVQVLEFYDYTASCDVKDPETGEKHECDGEFRVYLLRQAETGTPNEPIYRGPFPYTDAEGLPVDPIFPVALVTLPEYPCFGVAPVGSVYENNRELNYVLTALAQAFRKDVARVLLAKKGQLNETARDEIMRGDDWALAEIEGDEPLSEVVKWLDQQPVSSTILTYSSMLKEQLEQTSGTAPMTRGTPMKYVSATETLRLNDYSETTVGMYKDVMDTVLAAMAALYLRLLAAAMDDYNANADKRVDAVRMRSVDGSRVATIERKALDQKWMIVLNDAASTPLAETQTQANFEKAYPKILELLPLAAGLPVQPGAAPPAPVVVMFARDAIDTLVQTYSLPPEYTWAALSAAAQSVAVPPPMQPSPPPEAGAGPSPAVASIAGAAQDSQQGLA